MLQGLPTRPRPNRMLVVWRTLALSLAVAVALFSGVGCGVRHIREAQDAFNRGALAEQEMAEKATVGAWTPLVASGSPAIGEYKTALDLVDREIKENAASLESDGLYGNALVLKALCLWRLADLGDSELGEKDQKTQLDSVLLEIEKLPAASLGTRDRVLAKALDGLRDHDRGLRQADYDKAAANFRSALTKLDESIENRPDLPARHPMRSYVRLAQLRTCRAWLEFAGGDQARSDEVAQKYSTIVTKFAPLWKGDKRLYKLVCDMADAMGEDNPKPGP